MPNPALEPTRNHVPCVFIDFRAARLRAILSVQSTERSVSGHRHKELRIPGRCAEGTGSSGESQLAAEPDREWSHTHTLDNAKCVGAHPARRPPPPEGCPKTGPTLFRSSSMRESSPRTTVPRRRSDPRCNGGSLVSAISPKRESVSPRGFSR
jgi:hypothetical protein